MSNSSSQVDMSAQELSSLAAQLKEMVGKFKVKIGSKQQQYFF
jgi:methyl-accepting chemotaxis protein